MERELIGKFGDYLFRMCPCIKNVSLNVVDKNTSPELFPHLSSAVPTINAEMKSFGTAYDNDLSIKHATYTRGLTSHSTQEHLP